MLGSSDINLDTKLVFKLCLDVIDISEEDRVIIRIKALVQIEINELAISRFVELKVEEQTQVFRKQT